MRITYVLPRPEMGGGIKVALQHARLLRERGHEVAVLGAGPPPSWRAVGLPYHDYEGAFPRLPSQDLVIATFWTTLAVADRLAAGPLAHFCQGYEGGLVHLAAVLPAIEAAYRRPLPTLAVTPPLAEFLRARFGRESALAPPPVDPLFRPAVRLSPRRVPWIAIPGIFEAAVKDVPTALAAVAKLRAAGRRCRVLRVSVLPPTAAESGLLEADRYLCAVRPEEVARALRRCDLLLFPSRAEEGFGLPLLEAMAAKVPAVASRIPATEYVAGAARLVPPGDAAAFAAAAAELLDDARRWRRARRDGFRAARRFRPQAVAPLLDRAVRWARERALAPEGGAGGG
jgi:glycosyltransferase involved in cell wall biosynthesis